MNNIPQIHIFLVQSIEWIRQQADEIGLDFNLLGLGQDGVPHAFALWLTWNGTNPALKSILLNTHMDVVPVEPVSMNPA